MVNLNLRVFRRNVKNAILLWSSRHLTDDQRENLRVYAVEGNDYRELSYRPFVPDHPDKFAPDVCGVVISHSNNQLDPAEPCTMHITLGTGDNLLEVEKEILPASQSGPADPPCPKPTLNEKTINVRLYALDKESGNWLPVHLGDLQALKFETLLLKEQE